MHWECCGSEGSDPSTPGLAGIHPKSTGMEGGELRGGFASPQSCCSSLQPLSCPQGWVWEAFPGAGIHPHLQLPKNSMGSPFWNPDSAQLLPALVHPSDFVLPGKPPPLPSHIPSHVPSRVSLSTSCRGCLFPFILGRKDLILGTEVVETAFFAQVVAQ